MTRYKIGKMYRNCKEPFEYCFVNGHNLKDALAKAYSVLLPNHMQVLKVMEEIGHKYVWDYNISRSA